jgi:ribosomal protein S18 acetylase RimI-like enzyme
MQYRLISALPSHERWLENLRRSVYQELFHATWGGWDEVRHVCQFTECIKKGHISIIEVEGIDAGMVQLFDEPDAVDVAEIQVHPAQQNRGIGSRVLMDVIINSHRSRKCVRLSVGLKNERALRLYERLGFRRVAQSETHNHMECRPA